MFILHICDSGDYMLRLSNNLLYLRRIESRSEELQLDLVQIKPFLRTVLAAVQTQAADKQIETTLPVEPGLPALVTDELLLRRAVDNLLTNAIKYTPSGGAVRLTVARDGEGVLISVADTGIGLSPEEQERLFDRFFRSSRPEARRERGTGLGLALVRETARRLGGEVRVQSKVGVGSTFSVRLPVRHPDAPAERDAPANRRPTER